MNNEIDIIDFKLSIHALWKRRRFIIIIMILSTFVGILCSFKQVSANTYQARATVYSALYGSYQESVTGTTAILTYSDIVSSNKVCERAASILSEPTITGRSISTMISARINKDSAIMIISAFSTNSELSIRVANAVAEAFVIEIQRITGTDAIQVLDSANSSAIWSNGKKNLLKRMAIFMGVGLVLSCGIVILQELLSGNIKTIEQCKKDNEVIIGIIPHT